MRCPRLPKSGQPYGEGHCEQDGLRAEKRKQCPRRPGAAKVEGKQKEVLVPKASGDPGLILPVGHAAWCK